MYFPPSQFSHRFGTQFFTIEIPEYKIMTEKDSSTKFAVYKFTVKRGKQQRVIYYRYSEILQLHEYLCSTGVGAIASLCNFPPKAISLFHNCVLFFPTTLCNFTLYRRGGDDSIMLFWIREGKICRPIFINF